MKVPGENRKSNIVLLAARLPPTINTFDILPTPTIMNYTSQLGCEAKRLIEDTIFIPKFVSERFSSGVPRK